MTHLEIVRDLTKAQTVTITIRDLDLTKPPAAEIELTIDLEEEPVMTAWSASITASSDDAMETTGSGAVNLTGGQCYIDGTYSPSGLRFQNVTIPAGSTITAATLDLRVASASRDDPDLNIQAEDTDDAATYTTSTNDISGRTLTTASTQWTATGIGSGIKTSPDFTTVIQEIVDRGGWTSGNDIALILTNRGSSNFSFYSYDNISGEPAPKLNITYTEPAAGGTNPKTAGIRLTTKVGGTLTR